MLLYLQRKEKEITRLFLKGICLLYTSDAADE